MSVKLCYGQVQRNAMNRPFYVAAVLDLFAEQDLSVESKIFTSPSVPAEEIY